MGFVTPDGYEHAKKLLARRLGNPHHVAEAYKSKQNIRVQQVQSDIDPTVLAVEARQ